MTPSPSKPCAKGREGAGQGSSWVAPALAQLWHSLAAPGCRCRLAQHFQHAVLLLQSSRAASLGRAQAAEGAISRKNKCFKKKTKKTPHNHKPQNICSRLSCLAQPRRSCWRWFPLGSTSSQVHLREAERKNLFPKPQILHPSISWDHTFLFLILSCALGTAPRPPGVTQVQLQREHRAGSPSPPQISPDAPRCVQGSPRLTGSCRPGWRPGRPPPRRPPGRSGCCSPGPPRGKSPQSPPSPPGSPATPSWRTPGRL